MPLFFEPAGWDLAWIDGMTAEITKGTLSTSPEQCGAVVSGHLVHAAPNAAS